MAAQLQEVPPTEHSILGLVEAGPVPHCAPHVGRHVPLSLLERKLEEPLPDVDHSPNSLTIYVMIHHLQQKTM